MAEAAATWPGREELADRLRVQDLTPTDPGSNSRGDIYSVILHMTHASQWPYPLSRLGGGGRKIYSLSRADRKSGYAAPPFHAAHPPVGF